MRISKKSKKLYTALGITCITIAICYYEYQKGPLNDEWISTYTIETHNTQSNSAPEPTITVHIAGAVKKPGVYQVPAGLRTLDILKHANGLLPSANLDKINLASTVKDGNRIFIPHLKETLSQKKSIKKNNNTIPKKPININTANETQLQSLPGIGKSLAKKIINYRKEIGLFSNINELKNIKGIGIKTIKKWKASAEISI